MKIAQANFRAYRLPLESKLTTSTTERTIRHGWHIHLVDTEGNTGWGDVATWPGFGSGHHVALKVLRRVFAPEGGLNNAEVSTIPRLIQTLNLSESPEVQHGVELALLDLLSQTDQTPLRQRLNREAACRIPVCALVQTAQEAAHACSTGTQTIKLKVGRESVANDVQRIAGVRSAVGPRIKIRIDANGAWSLEQAKAAFKALEAMKLEWIEQPLAANNIPGNQELRSTFSTPIAIDEGITNSADLQLHIKEGALDVAVIKPMFVGGILAARSLAEMARGAGLKVAITTAIESNVGRMGALQLAASLENDAIAFEYLSGDELVEYFKGRKEND